jgi:hypothetical protein
MEKDSQLTTGQHKNCATNIDKIIEACQSDNYSGFCVTCFEEHFGVEPDAREYLCDHCQTNTVFGAEELLLETVA